MRTSSRPSIPLSRTAWARSRAMSLLILISSILSFCPEYSVTFAPMIPKRSVPRGVSRTCTPFCSSAGVIPETESGVIGWHNLKQRH